MTKISEAGAFAQGLYMALVEDFLREYQLQYEHSSLVDFFNETYSEFEKGEFFLLVLEHWPSQAKLFDRFLSSTDVVTVSDYCAYADMFEDLNPSPWSLEDWGRVTSGRLVRAVIEDYLNYADATGVYVYDEQVPADIVRWVRQFLLALKRFHTPWKEGSDTQAVKEFWFRRGGSQFYRPSVCPGIDGGRDWPNLHGQLSLHRFFRKID